MMKMVMILVMMSVMMLVMMLVMMSLQSLLCLLAFNTSLPHRPPAHLQLRLFTIGGLVFKSLFKFRY